MQATTPFGKRVSLDADLMSALDWSSARSPEQAGLAADGAFFLCGPCFQARREREQLISQLEQTGAELKKAGLCAEWFDGVDKGIAKVCQSGLIVDAIAILCQHV